MRIVSISENKELEKRVALTPDTTKKYISNGFEVSLSNNYATHLGLDDSKYKDTGPEIIEEFDDFIVKAPSAPEANKPYFLKLC